MADRSVQLTGHVWDSPVFGQLWALAETAIYRITERTGAPLRIGLKRHSGRGRAVEPRRRRRPRGWVSASRATPPRSLRQPDPDRPGRPGQPGAAGDGVADLPGAGALALVDGGLWVARFDGQGELDRLNAATGTLTGPFVVMPDDPTVLVERGDDLWVLSNRSSGNVRTVTKVTLTPAAK